jgi:hypothetical protein
MWDRVGMPSTESRRRLPWWQRRWPSILVLCLVLAAMGIVALVSWTRVTEVVPDVGKDKQGVDPWEDPLGVEPVGQFQIVHIPDCAAAPVVGIELWDDDSQPYWAVSGPPSVMNSFAIGATPEGFTVDTPFTAPPANAVLRLAVVRSVKGVAGVRFETSDLREGYVASGEPISRYGLDDFRTGAVCGDEDEASSAGATTTTTTVPGG